MVNQSMKNNVTSVFSAILDVNASVAGVIGKRPMKVALFVVSVNFASSALAQTCRLESISSSTPNESFIVHGDGTITDKKTGLMWKRCVEGLIGSDCASGAAQSFNWQSALQHAESINSQGGYASHSDWRVPNVREIRSIVEEQCFNPSINLEIFPNDPASRVWSSSPYENVARGVWFVNFDTGYAEYWFREDSMVLRLVRNVN